MRTILGVFIMIICLPGSIIAWYWKTSERLAEAYRDGLSTLANKYMSKPEPSLIKEEGTGILFQKIETDPHVGDPEIYFFPLPIDDAIMAHAILGDTRTDIGYIIGKNYLVTLKTE